MTTRVLVATADTVGERMAGPAIRALALARELQRRGLHVTLAAANHVDESFAGVPTSRLAPHDARRTLALAREYDAVLAQRLPVSAALSLARSETKVVYDLYDPIGHELLAGAEARPPRPQDELELTRERRRLGTALRAGNAFVCASERQRDLWLGALAAVGRLDAEEHARDPTFRRLIDVVPFGIDDEPPKRGGAALRGVLPGIEEGSRILIWGGGLWSWLDPLTPIRAVAELSRTVPEVRLVFMGLERPNGSVTDATMAERARSLAGELGVLGAFVVFNERWVPYKERGGWYTESDIGVSAHFDTLEARYAFRARILDYVWAGLPIATTEGDVLAELVEREGLGRALPAGDVSAWVETLRALLGDDGARSAAREGAASVRSRFRWSQVAEPLVRLLTERGRPVELSGGSRLAAFHDLYLSARISLHRRGARGTARAVLERGSDRTARLP